MKTGTEDLLDSDMETIKVTIEYNATTNLSIYFFPNGEPFDAGDYDQIISYYLGMTENVE